MYTYGISPLMGLYELHIYIYTHVYAATDHKPLTAGAPSIFHISFLQIHVDRVYSLLLTYNMCIYIYMKIRLHPPLQGVQYVKISM